MKKMIMKKMIMKKMIVKNILIVLALLGVASCHDKLNTKPLEAFDDTIWESVPTAQAFVDGSYHILGWLYTTTQIGGEDIWTDNVIPNSASTMLSETIRADNSDLGWNKFNEVRKCNMIIERVTASDFPQEDKDRLLGEGYFLRGVMNFVNARLFGGLILVDKVLTPDDDFLLPRSTIKETYDFIIADFTKAAELLAVSPIPGRISKGAALAMLGEAALHGAAYLDNLTLKNSYYDITIKSSTDLIALGNYHLEPIMNRAKTVYDYAFRTSPEVILHKGRTAPDNTFGNTIMQNNTLNVSEEKLLSGIGNAAGTWPLKGVYDGWMNKCVTHDIVRDYYLLDGTQVNDASFENNYRSHEYYGTVENKIRDLRFYQDIVWDSSMYFHTIVATRHMGNAHWASNPQATTHMTKSGYILRKFINETVAPVGSSVLDYMETIIRLPRVYFNYAEAEYRKNGNFGGAQQYIDEIKNRAGLPGAVASLDELKKERRIELFMENDRYWSLLRWGKEEDVTITAVTELNRPDKDRKPQIVEIAQDKYTDPLNNKSPKLIGTFQAGVDVKILGTTTNNPVLNVMTNRIFTEKRYLLPIPTQELRENPNLTQNPGW